MHNDTERYFRQCCVRIGEMNFGTGFFVAPGRLLTCAHVIHSQFSNGLAKESNIVKVLWDGRLLNAVVGKLTHESYPDLAELWLHLEDGSAINAPCVRLGTDYRLGDTCYIPAYSRIRSSMDGVTATIES